MNVSTWKLKLEELNQSYIAKNLPHFEEKCDCCVAWLYLPLHINITVHRRKFINNINYHGHGHKYE